MGTDAPARRLLGFLGGTFDPIHYGHLHAADDVRRAAGLDEVRLVPAGDPPHRHAPRAAAAHRVAMVRLALREFPGLGLDEREVRRAAPSYTVDTLASLRAEMPDAALCWLVGGDAFAGLTTWHEWERLFDLGHLVVVERPGFDLAAALPEPLARVLARRRVGSPARLRETPAGAILRQPITPHPVSGTQIRALLARGERPVALLPAAVLAYIEDHALYRTG